MNVYDGVRIHLRDPEFGNVLWRSLCGYGVAVIAEGIALEAEEEMLNLGEFLFDLPEATKERFAAHHPRADGFNRLGRARALDTGLPNLLESWRIGYPTKRVPRYVRAQLDSLQRSLRGAAVRCLSGLDFAMGSGSDLIDIAKLASSELHFLHYPKQALGKYPGSRRQSEHIDSSILTLTCRATSPGLQVDIGGELERFDAAPGDIVVMAGSALSYMSGGRVHAVRHTVETPESPEAGQRRISMVYFLSGQGDDYYVILGNAGRRSHNSIRVGDFESSYAAVYGSM